MVETEAGDVETPFAVWNDPEDIANQGRKAAIVMISSAASKSRNKCTQGDERCWKEMQRQWHRVHTWMDVQRL